MLTFLIFGYLLLLKLPVLYNEYAKCWYCSLNCSGRHALIIHVNPHSWLMHFVNNLPSYPVTAKNIQNCYTDVTDDKKVHFSYTSYSYRMARKLYGSKNFMAGLPLNRLDENLTGF